MERSELSLGEALAPIARRAAMAAIRDPSMSADALFCLGDALDELAAHIALTAPGSETESVALAALAEHARTLATSRAAP